MKKQSNPPPPAKAEAIEDRSVSTHQIAKAFTEWDRRYREDPEKFMSEAVRLLKETPETYGEACAPYFVKLIREVQGGKIA